MKKILLSCVSAVLFYTSTTDTYAMRCPRFGLMMMASSTMRVALMSALREEEEQGQSLLDTPAEREHDYSPVDPIGILGEEVAFAEENKTSDAPDGPTNSEPSAPPSKKSPLSGELPESPASLSGKMNPFRESEYDLTSKYFYRWNRRIARRIAKRLDAVQVAMRKQGLSYELRFCMPNELRLAFGQIPRAYFFPSKLIKFIFEPTSSADFRTFLSQCSKESVVAPLPKLGKYVKHFRGAIEGSGYRKDAIPEYLSKGQQRLLASHFRTQDILEILMRLGAQFNDFYPHFNLDTLPNQLRQYREAKFKERAFKRKDKSLKSLVVTAEKILWDADFIRFSGSMFTDKALKTKYAGISFDDSGSRKYIRYAVQRLLRVCLVGTDFGLSILEQAIKKGALGSSVEVLKEFTDENPHFVYLRHKSLKK